MPDARLPEGISGDCDDRFAAIPRILAEQLADGSHHGAAIAIYHQGRPVVDIWGGRRRPVGASAGGEADWSQDTMALSFSTTKGVAATALHMAMERAGDLSYDTPVGDVWPEFKAHGKDGVTIRHVLCHEAGIPQIAGLVPDVETLADWDAMVALMESLEPLWEPGTANGYHAVNFGWLVGELLRRIDGRPFPQFLAEEITAPLGLDGCYVGAPASEHGRVATLVGDESGGEHESVLVQLLGPDHLLHKVLEPRPADEMRRFVNGPLGLSACVPSFTGIFTARSLARIYAALERGGELDGVRLLSAARLAEATTVQNKRPDLALVVPIYWRLGYMSGGSGVSPAGPHREAYGHSGLGGSIAMADPRAELSIAVVLDRPEPNLLADDRARRVIDAAIAAVT